MKRLNIKLLVWLLVTPAILAVGIHFLHAYQIDRNAGSLKAQAEAAVKAGDSEDAIRQYSQYLKHRGDDKDAYGALAGLVADAAEKSDASIPKIRRALGVMEEAARRHGDLVDVLKRLVDLNMRVGRFRDAMDHIERLRADGHADSTELEIKYAQCLLVMGRDEKAEELLAKSIGYESASQSFGAQKARGAQEIEAYVLLAEVYRKRADDSKDADLVMEKLIESNPESAKAYAERGRFRHRQKRLDEADADLTRALEISPKDADILISAAEVKGALQKLDLASGLLNEGRKENPKDERIYRALASLALQQKKPDEAMKYVDAGLKQAPGNQYLLLFRADLELQKGNIDEVRATVSQMEKGELLPELINYIKCRILIAESSWLEATRELEKLRPMMARWPDLTIQIDLLLGQCFLKQGQPDRAIDAFVLAIESDPNSVPGRLGLAEAYRALGKIAEAEKVLVTLNQRVTTEKPESPEVGEVVNQNSLQTHIAAELRKPEDKRDWTQVDAFLDQVLKADRLTPAQKAVLRAEIMMLKKEFKQATEVLVKAIQDSEQKKELAVWLGWINLVSQDKSSKYTPEQIVSRAEKELGPLIQLKQVRLALAVRKEDAKEAKAAVKKLETDLSTLKEAERPAFLADLGNAYYRLRDYENARRCWLEVAKSRREDTKIQLTLFELAQEFGAEADMDATLDDIRKTQTANSALFKFCEAEKIVWQVKQKKAEPSALAAARKKLDEARKIRPEWHEIARVSGEINELEGKADLAIEDFKAALKLGPPNPAIARRLVALLYLRGRLPEVDEVMETMPSVADADPLKKLQIEKDMRQGKLDEALVDAKRVVDAEPENAANRLWYGQLLARAGKADEATKAFRDAVTKDPKLVQGWLLLVAHLANSKQKVEAQSVIREAKGDGKVPPELQNAFLAQAYEVVGDTKLAEENYLALLAKKPKDAGMLRNVASFYLRTNQVEKGHKQLDALLALPAASDSKATDAEKQNVTWARRAMAQIVAQRGDYRSLQEAIKMLETNKTGGKMAPEDMLLAAGILAKRPEHSSKVQALKWLEQVKEARSLTPDELFVLAQLYEQTGDWTKSREAVLDLVTRVEGNVGLEAGFAQMLMKHDELEEADRWIAKVEAKHPDTPLAIQLRARLLAKQGKARQAGEMIVKLLDAERNPDARLKMITNTVAILEEFEQYAAAEQILRDTAEKYPRAKIALGSFLGKHDGNLDEAFAMYEDSRKAHTLAVVTYASLDTLRRRSAEAGKQHFARVEGWLKTAIAEEPKSLQLQLQLADLHDIQGRTDEVISEYRQMLSTKDIDSKQRAIIDNNLAFVLAMNGSQAEVEEALRLINDAIDILGPSSDLLDTRAVCHLAQGNTKQAIDDLQAAIIDAPSAIKYIHLAMAQAKSGDKEAAGKSLEKARELKFDVNSLSAKERSNFQKLSQQLQGK